MTKPRNKYVTAIAVPQANKYEFEFTNAGLGYTRTVQSNNYHRTLNWAVDPLVVGQTYNVRVRASRDGGITFCPWGEVCTVTISATAQGGSSSMAVQPESLNLELWPNPGTGEQVQMIIAADGGDDAEVNITVLDAMGRIIHQQPARTDGLQWRGTVDFSKQLPTGQYFVRVAVGDVMETKRFVVAH